MANAMNSPKMKSAPPLVQQIPPQQQQIPKKFFPLVGYILKQTWLVFKQQIPMMILFGVLGWLLHTWLLVMINQGFSPSTPIGNFLATQGNSISGTIIWMVVSGFLFGWIGQLITNKGKTVIKPKQPGITEMFKNAGGLALAAILATAGLSLFIGIIVNKYANVTMALGAAGLMLSKGGAVVSLLISSAWSSTYGLAQNQKTQQFGAATGRIAMVGSIAGFLLCTFLPIWAKAIFGVAMLVAAFLLTRRQGQSLASLLLALLPMMLILGAIAVISKVVPVLADDGGWQESGGTLGGWLQSQGAVTAVALGIGPGIGSIVGPALGQALVNIGASIPIVGTEDGGPINPQQPIPQGPASGQTTRPTMTDEDGNTIPVWEPNKYGPDQDGKPGKPGDVWHWGKWVSPEQAQQEVNEETARYARDRAEQERNLAEWRAKNAEQLAKERIEGQRSIDEANQRRAIEAAQLKADQQMRDHILEKLKNDPSVGQDMRDAAADGNTEYMKEVYKEKLGEQMTQGQKDAAYYNKMATIYGAGEVGAKLIVAGSKGALIAIGGPAGMLATGVAVGSISAAQEGTQSYVNGDSAGQILEHTAIGFASGVKDGAIGVYTQMPGISTTAKYLIPAGADAAQTFIQSEINDPGNVMGNVGKALGSGALSIGTTYVGNIVDANTSGVVKEGLNLGTGVVGGAVGSVIQGGDPGEGALEGLIGSVGGRVGAHAGTGTLDYIRTQSETPVKTAIGEANVAKEKLIGLSGQSDKVQDLIIKTKYTGEDGKPYVDEHGALDQLRDTQSSRTAKQGTDYVKEPITNTRNEKIYKPADEATIKGVTPELVAKGIIKPGEKLEMDTFSTPGKGATSASVGADRDARLVVVRTDPETGQPVKVEIPREHWEDKAYKDFYDHTTKIAGGEQAITPEKYPAYTKRVEEMTNNNPQNLSTEQIKARAWAEEHNQLFTDKNHVEASRDNADQINKFVGNKEVQTQSTPNVLSTQQGNTTLLDPPGYAKMWQEKSDAYQRLGNQPEAIAQSQKGVDQYMKIRQGYDKQGLNVPPLDNQTAKAMEIISKAPVGVDATPAKMAEVNQQLKNLGFKDTYDALGKVAMQNEGLGFAQPKGMSTANTVRIGISGINQPPPDAGPPPDGTVY